MTENQWWSSHVKPRWHNLQKKWVARKVQDVTNKGAPDVDACWDGYSCKVELKYATVLPARPETKLTFSRYSKDEPNRRTIVSREQLRNLQEWSDAGGNAFILVGIDKEWWLLTAMWLWHPEVNYNDGMTVQQLDGRCLLKGFRSELALVPEYLSDPTVIND